MSVLGVYKRHLASIRKWAHRKVQPYRPVICSALLDWYTIELFVGILLRYHLHTEFKYTIKGNTICLSPIDVDSEEECYEYDPETRSLKNEQGAIYYRQTVE